MTIPSPVSQACSSHKIKRCQDPNCLHLLPLHQCLGSTSVWCGYFKVDTSCIRRHFPLETGDWCQLDSLAPRYHQPPSPPWLRGGLLQNISTFASRIPDICQNNHCSGAAKLLDAGQAGSDWRALAAYLGYNHCKVGTWALVPCHQ